MSDVQIELTDSAREKFIDYLAAENDDGLAIRLEVAGRGPHGLNYQLDFVDEAEEAEGHVVLDFGEFRMLVDPGSVEETRERKIVSGEHGDLLAALLLAGERRYRHACLVHDRSSVPG